MNRINDILKSTQWMRDLYKPIGLNSQIVEMLKTQERISKSITPFSSMTDITKMMNNQIVFSNPSILAMERITKSMQFAIPHTAIDTMMSIAKHHASVFDSVKAITEAFSIQSPILSQINNLNLALNGISTRVANIAKIQQDWSLLDEFEGITESGFNFSESLSQQLDEEQDRHFGILLENILAFLNKHRAFGISALLVIDIFLRFADVHQYYDFLKEKPELATKVELNKVNLKQDTALHFIRLIDKELKKVNEYRITNRSCFIKLKPKLKAFTLTKLPPDFEVVVLQIHHKWVYISYFDPIDNLPNTGWIPKKYLNKP